jgi:hypothetical protein
MFYYLRLDHRDFANLYRGVAHQSSRILQLSVFFFRPKKLFKMLDVGSSGMRIQPYYFYERWNILEVDGVDVQTNLEDNHGVTPKIPFLLSDVEEEVLLNHTTHPGCTSLYKVSDYVKKFDNYKWFDICRKEKFFTKRGDSIFKTLDDYDYMKFDIQGSELQALKGFGELLDSIDCIEVESHFIPMYKGEKVFEELRSFLSSQGFALRKIRDSGFTNKELYEFDAFFTRERPKNPLAVVFFELIHDIPNTFRS